METVVKVTVEAVFEWELKAMGKKPNQVVVWMSERRQGTLLKEREK